MGWSFRLGRLAGIDIFVHYTFLILLAFIGLNGYLQTGSWAAGVLGLVLTTVAFGIILLHEFGHAMAARYYGIPTRDITLLPIGGVARLERMPDKPAQELVVSLAGPAVNVVLAVVFGLVFSFDALSHPEAVLTLTGAVSEYLLWFNVLVVVFNLIPAFPMDGGRVLRALLAMRLGGRRATEIAARFGKGMALLFGLVAFTGVPLLGFQPNIMLLLVALFVWSGADAEARAYWVRGTLSDVPAAAVMLRRFAVVAPDDRLESVTAHAGETSQRHFPVVVGGRPIGLLATDDVRDGLARFGTHARVFQAMGRTFATVAPDEPAERALRLLAEGAPVVLIVAYGQLAGLITPQLLSRYVPISCAPWSEHRSEPEIRSGA